MFQFIYYCTPIEDPYCGVYLRRYTEGLHSEHFPRGSSSTGGYLSPCCLHTLSCGWCLLPSEIACWKWQDPVHVEAALTVSVPHAIRVYPIVSSYHSGMTSYPSCPIQWCPPGIIPHTLSNPKCHGPWWGGPRLQLNLQHGQTPSGKGLPAATGTTGNYVQGGKVSLPPISPLLSRHCHQWLSWYSSACFL